MEEGGEVEGVPGCGEEGDCDEHMFKWAIVVGVFALAMTFIVGYLLESQHVEFIPEAGVGVLMGFVVASIAKYIGSPQTGSLLLHESFDFEFFMTWLLPPIIFEAGFNMNKTAFFQNIGPTMLYAFFGTFASTFVVGGIVFWAGQQGWCHELDIIAALTFGSLISATDPVTVLAVFQAIGVRDDLFSMVFGESVLNDAVAIVLSRTLVTFAGDNPAPINSENLMAAGNTFLTIFIGSTLIGLVYGLLSAWVFKKLNLRNHDELHFMESALSFAFPWAAYFTAEASALSGIVAILFCGIVMATYTRLNLSKTAVMLTSKCYKCVALISETFVFVYIGMAIVTFPIMQNTVWAFVLVATGACFVGRLHIPLFSFLTNCVRNDASFPPRINAKYQFIMWWSGLRGGVAFALATMVYGKGYFPPDQGLAILQSTMIIAVFTIFVFGGSITGVARKMGVLKSAAEKVEDAGREDSPMPEGGLHAFLLTSLTHGHSLPAGHSGKTGHESGARFGAAMDTGYSSPENSASKIKGQQSFEMTRGPGKSTHEIKSQVAHSKWMTAIEQVTSLSRAELSTADKVDALRARMPSYSADALTRMLASAGGDLETATKSHQARAEML